MDESTQAVLGLVIIIAIFGSWFAWTNEGPRTFPEHIVAVRIGLPVAGAGALALLLRAHYRRDKLPDMLGKVSPWHFNCDGLSFAPVIELKENTCFICIYFQNRHERPCDTRLLIRPAIPNFGLRRPRDIATIDLKINCEGAAFGVVRVPLAIPHLRQGTNVRFNVGGETDFPNGRGKLVRYTEGARIGPPTNLADTALTIFAAFALVFYRHKEASFKLKLPVDVKQELPANSVAIPEVLWRPEVPTPV